MSDNGGQANMSGSSGIAKKSRRGKRANNKPNPINVEQMLATTLQKIEVQPKKRPPRRPKAFNQGSNSIDNNSEISPAVKLNTVLPEQTNAIAVNHIQAPIVPQIIQNQGVNLMNKKKLSTKCKKNHLSKNQQVIRGQTENLSMNIAVGDAGGNRRKNKVSSTPGKSTENKKGNKTSFPDYIPQTLIRKLLVNQTSKEIEYVEGNIRINPKCFKEAYVAMPNDEMDILIDGIHDRNRALEGDLVAVKINPTDKWRNLKSNKPQKTATVVCILEKIHPRKAVGFLKVMPDKNNRVALFAPRDHKVPRLTIDSTYWPPNFYSDPESYANIMFSAEIISWNDVRYAHGKILKCIGKTGDLRAESCAIVLEYDLDMTPYSTELTQDLPPSDYQPVATDIDGREDWRKKCIFTIDPATAADLDDAMSCSPMENGNFEVGVHIADVTHYLNAFTPLDQAVARRATTIYLSDNVYHMLPKQLCNVCSLLPGYDKLAFSVIFEMTPGGDIVRHRFAKTVINSCCQFSYEHAQVMIMNPTKKWSNDEIPVIKGSYTISELCTVVNSLNNLAVKMREKRFENGSLRIDQPKLHVIVDRESGLPISFTLEEQKDSNRLIEEFMLLANMTVARHLYENFPDVSLLRCHQPPLMRNLSKTQTMLEKFGIHIDIESAGALQASLVRYQPDPCGSTKDFYLAKCRAVVMNILCAKTMARARYFCTSVKMDAETLKHYALNVPLYTHFTSPIRRYSDCIVHRLLHASIQNALPVPNWTPSLCAEIAMNCNRQKYNAKLAQEASSELYLTYLLGLTGPVNTTAITLDVKDRSIDIILYEMGINLRIYFAELEKVASVHHVEEDDIQTVTIVWKDSNMSQVINIFSIVNVRVSKDPAKNRLLGELLAPMPLDIQASVQTL
ncbi:DIS3-like exonuclease 2 isoform X1 [Neodiprion pinetum]|uniref:DIS3-like exonuclease 2 isoform X1 n=2 Tax=Neodiprion pinetum TaxID=441929 RepID=UPI001EDE53CD|nr:DIS3-like exonuclease 2 isoform X1 [Neodiprion pinetum]